MFTLFHHPFCPHSRFIRLVTGELGLETRLVEELVAGLARPDAKAARRASRGMARGMLSRGAGAWTCTGRGRDADGAAT